MRKSEVAGDANKVATRYIRAFHASSLRVSLLQRCHTQVSPTVRDFRQSPAKVLTYANDIQGHVQEVTAMEVVDRVNGEEGLTSYVDNSFPFLLLSSDK